MTSRKQKHALAYFHLYTSLTYDCRMLTVIETPTFQRLWPDYWTEEERAEFAAFLAAEPEAGDVVPGSGGVRKVRWSRAGEGKRGGVRVIYFNQLPIGEIWLLLIYARSQASTIPAHVLREIRMEVESCRSMKLN